MLGDVRPIIINVCNFSKPAAGEPALLSFDDARTLFHEFGHALHGLLSNVTYPLLAGTAVPSDFVELPSQLYEHWLEVPEILQKYARHARDRRADAEGAARPAARDAHLQSGLCHGGIHVLRAGRSRYSRVCRTRARSTSAISSGEIWSASHMPAEIVMRHRLPHFQHLFSGGGYAAGYYSYMWSEVLDADAFEAFDGDRQRLRSGHRAGACAISSTAPAICAIRPRPIKPSAAGCRRSMRSKARLADAAV